VLFAGRRISDTGRSGGRLAFLRQPFHAWRVRGAGDTPMGGGNSVSIARVTAFADTQRADRRGPTPQD